MENKIVLKYMGEDLYTFEGKETVNDIIDAVKECKELYNVDPENLTLAFVSSNLDNTIEEEIKEDVATRTDGSLTYTGFDSKDNGNWIIDKGTNGWVYVNYQDDEWTQTIKGYVIPSDYEGLYDNKYGYKFTNGKDHKYFAMIGINSKLYGVDSIEDGIEYIKSNTKVSESIAVDTPEKEYTIWSSADIVESGEQIPLVKIKVTDDGELEAEAVGDDDFDKESLKIATTSLKSTVGRSVKDRLLRVDKSLNHADPFFSTELYRDNIRANRGLNNKDIADATTNEDGSNQQGLQLLANQILLTNRDDLKAAANNKSANEEKIVDLFNQMTGVDYYTGKIIDQDQYNYILDLLGRSYDKYNDSHVAPDENMYVQNLKDLAEDLIEKVLLKTNPDFYKL